MTKRKANPLRKAKPPRTANQEQRAQTDKFPPARAADVSRILESLSQTLGIAGSLQETELVKAIEQRLPLASISTIVEHGLLEKEVYELIVPRRTLQHRRARKEALSVEESDRAVRVARIMALTESVFGDPEKGMRWVRAAKRRFGGRTAMEMLATEAGSRLVEEMLYQIDEGVAA